MYQITSRGARVAIEAAGNALAEMDPSPALAVDMKEENRTQWRLDAYADDMDTAQGCVGIIELLAPDLPAVVAELEDKDWVALSLEGLPAVKAGPFVVAGAHALAHDDTGRIPLWVEAGPAFGTGHHGTTLGCLKAYAWLLRQRRPRNVLDIGTGTGVLALAAMKTGARFALGTDIDPGSVRISRVNGENNRAGPRYRVLLASGTKHAAIQERAPFDLVFANILAGPLIQLAPDIAGLVAPGGHVILSGLLSHQEPLVRKAYEGFGFVLRNRDRLDGWSTLTYIKPSSTRPGHARTERRAIRSRRRARSRGDAPGAVR